MNSRLVTVAALAAVLAGCPGPSDEVSGDASAVVADTGDALDGTGDAAGAPDEGASPDPGGDPGPSFACTGGFEPIAYADPWAGAAEHALECGTPVPVATAAEVIALLPPAWFDACAEVPDPSSPRYTSNFRVDAAIEIVAADLPFPEAPGYEAFHPDGVVLDCAAGGCSVLETGPVHRLTGAVRVRLDPGLYRLGHRVDIGVTGFYGHVTVAPPCTAECPEGGLRCPVDRACWDPDLPGIEEWFDAWFCRDCLGGHRRVCACWTLDGPVPDGTPCNFREQACGCVDRDGTCVGGVCC